MSTQANPLDFSFNLAGVETAYPALAVGEYPVTFEKWETKPTKNDGEIMVRFTVSTLEPAFTVRGNTQEPPGFKLGFNITLPSANTPADQVTIRNRQMALFLDALYKTTQENRPPFNSETLNAAIGKPFIVVIKKAKDDQYGETEIKGYKPIPE